ncbi:MAG TPA: putative toxin-antitoxin system toxin component, PIN family [Candidatus Deferrimicrobiaceae bacterium]
MKVVLDTNVFVSSFYGGNPRKVIDLWRQGAVTLCLSGPIVEEYLEVLRRMGLGNSGELEELARLFAEGFNLLFFAQPPRIQVVPDDPDDDRFFECAVALSADFIVSGDKHLLRVGNFRGIPVYGVKEFLDRFPASPDRRT